MSNRHIINISTAELLRFTRKEALDFLIRKHHLSPLCSLCQVEYLTEIKLWDTIPAVVYGLCDLCRALPDSTQRIEQIIREEYPE